MSGFIDLFIGANFKNTIQKFCTQYDLNIYDLNDKRAVLRFDMDSGRTQTLYIIKYDTTLEFSVPSEFSFDDDDIPHALSTLLLKRNSQRKIGFWCIEEINNQFNFECMHNADMRLIDGQYFKNVILALITECDEFEEIIHQIINS